MPHHKAAIQMKMFENVKQNLASIDFHAGRHWYNSIILYHICKCILALVLQFAYLYCVAETTEEVMTSIFTTAVGTLVFFSYLSTISKITNIYFVIDKIEKIVNKRLKRPTLKAMYEKTNELSETFSKVVYFLILNVSIPFIVLPRTCLSYFSYYTTDAGREAFELPIPTWFPFDWQNPVGYAIAVLLQLKMVALPLRYIASNLTLAFSGFLFALSIAKDIKITVHSMSVRAKAGKSMSTLFKQFCDLIRFTALKPLLHRFTDIYEITILILFLGATSAISLSLLMINMEMTRGESVSLMLVEAIFFSFWAITLIGVVCELGQRFSNAFQGFDITVNQLEWYTYPLIVQRMLPIILMNAHDPIVIKCFGGILCERDTFKRVINTAYSYFMMVREFYN